MIVIEKLFEKRIYKVCGKHHWSKVAGTLSAVVTIDSNVMKI